MTLAQSDGRRARGDKARAAVLEHAIAIASTRGLGAITLGGLADDAGVSKANLSVLFGDKESLQLATIDEAVRRFVEAVLEPARSKARPLARLKALCEGWFVYVEQPLFPGGCFLFSTMHEYRARPGPFHDRIFSYFDTWRRIMRKELRTAKQDGQLRPGTDVDQVVFALMAYQNAAHLAMLVDDGSGFDHARKLTRLQLQSVELAPVNRK